MGRPESEGAWITDLRHFLGADGQLVEGIHEQALSIALFTGSIVAWVTGPAVAHRSHVTNVHCRRKPRRKRCRGEIEAVLDSSTTTIRWHCPVCGYHGLIRGWEGSPWDRRVADA